MTGRAFSSSRALFLLLLGGGIAAGVPSQGWVQPEGRPTFSTTSSVVVLHVSVRDRRGAHVDGLSKDVFTIRESGRTVPLAFFSGQDAPVSVGLLIDGSGSMGRNRPLVITAGVSFAQTSNPLDEIFVIGFNEAMRMPLPPEAPFTSDIPTLRSALGNALPGSGLTAVYDALGSGLEYVAKGRHDRQALVLVSDGGDNASRLTRDEILRRIATANVMIYSVGVVDPIESGADPRFLRQIARSTGGEAFFPRDATQVAAALEQVARDIRSMYTLGFVPAEPVAAGELRTVEVAVRSPRHGSLAVRTRSGYITGGGSGEASW